ncbi:SDR family NAD(P)-dependent oxidoreductase [Paenibacillus sp. HJGM_3]|uniref:SDR family NAD(P)-dependent oxidoreductase n=1 Tax=Paenibacillus sp. HJGM_3 TaxID=3379816 RepID=UPI00385D3E77
MLLSGKTALITGATRGIGRAIAQQFAEMGAGVTLADVLVEEGKETAERIRGQGGEAQFVSMDVTDEEAVRRTFAGLERLDILVNNAGITTFASVEQLSLDAWNRTLAVNATSVFLCSKYALPLLKRSAAPAIVNMSSVNSFRMNPSVPAYAASKGAVVALTQQMAMEYATYGIRVNCISPGVTRKREPREEEMADGREAILRDCFPLGRTGRVEDVAKAAVYLASDWASFVTGVDLVVDGGTTLQNVSALVRPELRARWKPGAYRLESGEGGCP